MAQALHGTASQVCYGKQIWPFPWPVFYAEKITNHISDKPYQALQNLVCRMWTGCF